MNVYVRPKTWYCMSVLSDERNVDEYAAARRCAKSRRATKTNRYSLGSALKNPSLSDARSIESCTAYAHEYGGQSLCELRHVVHANMRTHREAHEERPLSHARSLEQAGAEPLYLHTVCAERTAMCR